jgi:phenylalanyl-tRNA synthetase beta chain
MKVSVSWLQKYFAEPLPNTEELVDTLTFHSSEVEEVIGEGEKTVLDVKVLPDRAAYGLSHRGIAYELAAALGHTLVADPLREPLPGYAASEKIVVSIENPQKSPRYMAALVTGVKVAPSPDWLRAALESVGQRSINNVVDATNYVMLNIGQPLHAFDAGKLKKDANGAYGISVRGASEGEKITTLTGEEFSLPEGALVIVDSIANALIGIAGIKGGKAAQIDEGTTDILIESANFDGTSVRRASQALKLWTDASLRFQNKISPELAAYGMRDVLALILEVAGGEAVGTVDTYPTPEAAQAHVTATLSMINGVLGTSFVSDDLTDALTRLGLEFVVTTQGNGDLSVTVKPPFERRDLVIWQDLAEEVGRILGYDRVEPTPLPAMPAAPDQAAWRGIEAMKDVLTERGFTEISTQSFAAEGEIMLANPLQSDKPWLRASLVANMGDALARAAAVAPRVLGPESQLKLFELGTVFTKEGEYLSLCLGYAQLVGKQSAAVLAEAVDAIIDTFPSAGIVRPSSIGTNTAELSLKAVDVASIGEKARPTRIALQSYRSFSLYPSALRDIAVWTPEGTEESEVAMLIEKEAGELLARIDIFDRFEKDGRISYAFRLVFQSFDRTLSDADLDPTMAAVTAALNAREGWEVR